MGARLLIVVVSAALALAGCGGSIPEVDLRAEGSAVEGVEKGNILPDIALATLGGETVSVGELRGQPLVVNFWATWCGPCAEEIPMLDAAYKANSADGLKLLAITDETLDAVRPFMQIHEMSFPVLLDKGKAANNKYRVQAIPTTFFVDRSGVIVERHLGALGENLLKIYLEKIMGSPPGPTPAPAKPTSAPLAPTSVPAARPTVPAPQPNVRG
jgi:thiol-disulfide isomerase/thioredoxin